MTFADDLNSKVGKYYDSKAKNTLTESTYIADRVKQYTKDIESLCTKRAEEGQRSLIGFFVPKRVDYNYETTIDGPFILDKPKRLINKKPSLSTFGRGLAGGSSDLFQAEIHLIDDPAIRSRIPFQIDGAMIEKVRIGVMRNLANAGFKKLEIEHLTGRKYELKTILSEIDFVSHVGTSHYFYVDIAW